MANYFSTEIVPLENFSRGDHQEITESKNRSFPAEFCDTDEEDEEDTADLESVVSYKVNLEERLKRLQTTMGVLRRQLAEERYMWKKQLDEAMQESAVREHRPEILGVDDAIDLAKETEITEDIQSHLANLPRPEYEGMLSAYQEDVIKALADRRANLRRQISINNYKRRLLEVENMCNLELLRVKQSVQFLQPLQMMASEWTPRSTHEHNFANEEMTSIEAQESPKDHSNIAKVEETFSMELSCNRLYSDTNSVFTKPQFCNLQSPQTNSPSAIWQVGDDLVMDHPNSSMWY